MCASQCHEGHNVIEKESNDICKCNHQHPKINIFSSIFKKELTKQQEKLFSLTKRIKPNLGDDVLLKMVENFNPEEISHYIELCERKIKDEDTE